MSIYKSILFILLFLVVSCCYGQFLSLPTRPADALSGSEFADKIRSLSLHKREQEIFAQIRQGNVPDFMRRLIPITVTSKKRDVQATVTYYVTCDYVCIGSNDDYFFIPMTPVLAQQVCDYLDCSLPTTRIVDQIWRQAPVKMTPSPIPPDSHMTSVPAFKKHNKTVCGQRSGFLANHPLGTLVAGNKKDVVVTNQLAKKTGRVAIYGWHRPSGSNIQPLYLGHGDLYADYSHGIRLIQNTIMVNGEQKRIRELIADSQLATILSSESTIRNPRYPVPITSYCFPLRDNFQNSGRDLSMWFDKFTSPKISIVTGNKCVTVCDPSGGLDTISLKTAQESMYVEADIYCLYRPELASNGFERVGIFARDDGDAAFEHTYGGGGSCYGMAWDSYNGRLWCFRSDEGRMKDLNSTPVYMTGTKWLRMRIETKGTKITFWVNGRIVLMVNDSKYRTGGCGIGYHEYFSNNNYIMGTRAKKLSGWLVGLIMRCSYRKASGGARLFLWDLARL